MKTLRLVCMTLASILLGMSLPVAASSDPPGGSDPAPAVGEAIPWQPVGTDSARYRARGGPDIELAGTLKRTADGRMRVGRLPIARESERAMGRWIGRTLEVRGKLLEAYRYAVPPLLVGSVRPVELVPLLAQRLTALPPESSEELRALVRWLTRSGREAGAALAAIAAGGGPAAERAGRLLDDLLAGDRLYMEVELTAAAAPADEVVAMTGRLIRLDPRSAVLPVEAGRFACHLVRPGASERPLRIAEVRWEADDPLVVATVRVDNVMEPLAEEDFPAGRCFVRLTVRLGEAGERVVAGGAPVRLLSGRREPLGSAEQDRQMEWLDALAAPRWGARVRARRLLQDVSRPAYHRIERALDDADPQIAAEAAHLLYVYAEAVNYLGIRFTPTPAGVQVDAVLSDSPADRAGIRAGDQLERFNDVDLRGQDGSYYYRIAGLIRRMPPGASVALAVVRDKNRLEIETTLGRIEPEVEGYPQGYDPEQAIPFPPDR